MLRNFLRDVERCQVWTLATGARVSKAGDGRVPGGDAAEDDDESDPTQVHAVSAWRFGLVP